MTIATHTTITEWLTMKIECPCQISEPPNPGPPINIRNCLCLWRESFKPLKENSFQKSEPRLKRRVEGVRNPKCVYVQKGGFVRGLIHRWFFCPGNRSSMSVTHIATGQWRLACSGGRDLLLFYSRWDNGSSVIGNDQGDIELPDHSL